MNPENHKMFPKLYSTRSDGKIQEWQAEVAQDMYRFHSGIKDGKIVTTQWSQATPKNVGKSNETTPHQQALSEAESHHTHRLEREYRLTVEELASVGDVFFEPMLAKKFEDQKTIKYPVMSQPKLDGMRCIIDERGAFSREGQPITSIPHVLEYLQPIFEKYPDLRFDGEIYTDKLKNDFNEIMSLARKAKPNAAQLAEAKETLEYHIYDCYAENTTFEDRYDILRQTLFPEGQPTVGLSKTGPIVLVETRVCVDAKELDEAFEEYLAADYEGQMVRDPGSFYENKRSKFLLKRKNFQDTEFEVFEIHEGVGNRAGMAGRVTMKLPDGRLFGVDPMGNSKYRRELLKNAEAWKGKPGTVKFFKYTPDGIPRFGKLKEVKL